MDWDFKPMAEQTRLHFAFLAPRPRAHPDPSDVHTPLLRTEFDTAVLTDGELDDRCRAHAESYTTALRF